MNEIILETIKLLGIAFSASFASGGIIMYFIKKNDRVHDLEHKVDRLCEGMELSIMNDKVIFKALREGHINGESERQEKKLDEFIFKKSIELLNEGGTHCEKY